MLARPACPAPPPRGAQWKDPHMPLVDDRTQQLIDVLADCLAKCEACAKDCASQGNADLAACIALCSDCATLCQACIPLLARGSEFSAQLCQTCADACERCAQECERTGMTECAEACRKASAAGRLSATAALHQLPPQLRDAPVDASDLRVEHPRGRRCRAPGRAPGTPGSPSPRPT